MEQDATPKAPRAGTRGWVKVVLAVSLALNLAVIGLVAGVGANRLKDGGHSHAPRTDVTSFGPYSRALPEAARDRIRVAYSERNGDLRAARQDMRKDFRALQDALSAVPYNEATVVTIMERQRGRIDSQVLVVRRLFLDEVAAMSDAERAELAGNLKTVLRRGPPKGDRK